MNDPSPSLQSPDRPERTEAEQRAFYDAVLARALDAEARVGVVERFLEVAGARFKLVFAGDRLAREFMGALAHLETPVLTDVDAVFHVWDSASTGVAMVPPPCSRDCFTDRGDLWGFSSRVTRSAFHWSEYSISVLDTQAGVGVYWVDTAENLPFWAKSSPLRTLFHWVMEGRGLQLIHAAAVGTDDGGVLITGKGGVGKSTTALTALAAGMSYVGDDYLIVGLDPEPVAYSLYNTAKLEPHQLALLPELAPLTSGPPPAEGEKAVIYLYPEHEARLAKALPLKWVLTPRFGDGAETTFEPVSPVELHRAAAFTTMAQLPHAGLQTHEFIGRMVAGTPSRRIVLGKDVRRVPGAISGLLAKGADEVTPVPTKARQPLVTVVIPVFNGAGFLRAAIDSVLAQNYPALEIIVVDDGSTDDIEAAVAALPVDVRLFRQPNQGPAAARNRGVRDASGAYLAFLDVDDLWPPETLSQLVERLQGSPQTDVVQGRGQLARIMDVAGSEHELIGSPDESFPHYIGAAVYRRDAFRKNGLFDEEMRFGEDTDWFTRAKEMGLPVEQIDQTTLIVRRHAGNMTRGKSMVELNVLRVFKKALDRKRSEGAGDPSANP